MTSGRKAISPTMRLTTPVPPPRRELVIEHENANGDYLLVTRRATYSGRCFTSSDASDVFLDDADRHEFPRGGRKIETTKVVNPATRPRW